MSAPNRYPEGPYRSFLPAAWLAATLCAFVVRWAVVQLDKGTLIGEALAMPPTFLAIVSWLPFTMVRDASAEFRRFGRKLYVAMLALAGIVVMVAWR
jgi:hypothetical protein